jgi:hypothetical protein
MSTKVVGTVTVYVVNGVPTDGSFDVTPPDGTVVSAPSGIYQRISGSWVTSAAASLPIQSAYTQTYAVAAKTVPAATAAAVATTAATQTTPYGFGSAAQADAIPVAINANAADILALKKVVNALIDDLQTLGLAG